MKTVAVVTGGNSGEEVISFQSADLVIEHINKSKFNVYKVVISGKDWYVEHEDQRYPIDKNDFSLVVKSQTIKFDCVFMALHGTPAEDGKLSGYFDLLNIPYTCCGTATSAITFNKAFTISLLKQYGISAARFILLRKGDAIDTAQLLEEIGLPCFVKPNEGGSSIGISKVSQAEDLEPAIAKAFKEDNAVLIEEFLDGTEITCGVVCHDGQVKALAVTEIVTNNEFFDFEAKYQDEQTQEITPARISDDETETCMRTSEYIYSLLNCHGIVRIDYMLNDERMALIEVNTIPGLTEKSLLPQQAVYTGMSLPELFTKEIEEAICRSES